MELNDSQKLDLLHKAADITMQAASTGKFAPDSLTDIMELSYEKLISLAEGKDQSS
jgi:hypothetical protein